MQLLQFLPMPLLKRPTAFNDPDWIFELKYDGYRSLAVIEHGRAQLLSRNGHLFASFSELGKQISDSLPNATAIIDGEICSLDRRGRPQFKNLMFRISKAASRLWRSGECFARQKSLTMIVSVIQFGADDSTDYLSTRLTDQQ